MELRKYMNNSDSKITFISYGYELAFLLQTGGYWLEKLYYDKGEVKFSKWKNKIIEQTGKKIEDKQLRWLWKALVTEPNFKLNFRKEFLISYNQELKIEGTRIPILPRNEKITIFLKNALNEDKPIVDVKTMSAPDGEIILIDTLEMQPGKEDFFECCEVNAELIFKVKHRESLEEEASILQLDIAKVIFLEEDILKIKIDSLNHAFKLIDMRISREKNKNKKSPGGSIYVGNLAWVNNDQYISLGKIKYDVEEGEWIFPGESKLLESEG